MQKTILLAAPYRFGFTKMFVQNLEFYGYKVIDIGYCTDDFEYASFKDRLIDSFKKLFLSDKLFKKQLMYKQHKKTVLSKLDALGGKADYALIVRSDLYAKDLIKIIKENSNKIIGYQWDGIERYPEILEHISLYDSFYVFDDKDAKKYSELNIKPITNFYFDFDDLPEIIKDNKKFFYIGIHQKEKLSQINEIATQMIAFGYKPDVYIYSNEVLSENDYSFPVKFITEMMTYKEALDKAKEASILLDFVNSVPNGLSFRIFEALRYQKKLITNNHSVESYPFYHSNNIYLLNSDKNNLSEFLQLNYQSLPKDIVYPYSFGGWIEDLLKD